VIRRFVEGSIRMNDSWSQPGRRVNRSAPPGIVIPLLDYPDVPAAAEWLCRAIGFSERLRIGHHRMQLTFGGASLVLSDGSVTAPTAVSGGHSLLIRVADVDAHYSNAVRHGAKVVREPADHPYGEKQYVADDPAGHRWTFSQSVADVEPAAWGGELLE
jgi:uncharacterized glyoxalase superfamily protein PhnB